MERNERQLLYKFFGLSYPSIIQIGNALGVLLSTDSTLSDTEKANAFYSRAREQGKTEMFFNLVESKEAGR